MSVESPSPPDSELRGSRDCNDPRLLGKELGDSDLCRRHFPPFSDAGEQINQRLIRLASLRRESRKDVTEVRTVGRSVLVEPSREVALAESAIGNEADSEFLERRQHLRFRV